MSIAGEVTAKEMVNHPSHYQGNGIEVIDVIEAFDLGFCLGNVVKYVLRAGKKDERLQELRKARWYLEREISNEAEARNAEKEAQGIRKEANG